jgi:hypothetical protein
LTPLGEQHTSRSLLSVRLPMHWIAALYIDVYVNDDVVVLQPILSMLHCIVLYAVYVAFGVQARVMLPSRQ